MKITPPYVLITPAKNEEQFIDKMIQSVLSQTCLPQKWAIVSDGSVDGTDDIVLRYAEYYDLIEFIKASSKENRNFGSKVNAINAGHEKLKNVKYDFIGIMDADISFESDYFENILNLFGKNNRLGIGGGIITELINGNFIEQNISLNSVAGATQVFRRECYEDIGGYTPIETGGIDSLAEIKARMKGWEVRTFPEFKVYHHRRVANSQGGILRSKFRAGIRDYSLGYHPLFYFFMCSYRIIERPIFIGSVARILGYLFCYISRKEIKSPPNVVAYLRREQIGRLRSFLVHKSCSPIRKSN